MTKVKVWCAICHKEELVYKSRAIKYKTCSFKCLGKYNKLKDNVECASCGKKLHLQPKRLKRLVDVKNATCSLKCAYKLKKINSLGIKNPNKKYMFDDDFFKEINTEDKAYLLGG